MASPVGSGAADARDVSEADRQNPYHSASGPASSTAGPHKHNIVNKLDPRIDSDLDGSKTTGTPPGTGTSTHTASSSSSYQPSSYDGRSTTQSTHSSQPTPGTVYTDPLAHSIHSENAGASARDMGPNLTRHDDEDEDDEDWPIRSDVQDATIAPPASTSTDPAMGATFHPTRAPEIASRSFPLDTNKPLPPSGDQKIARKPVSATSGPLQNTTDPRIDYDSKDVNTGGRVLGHAPEKESIWTAGSVPGPGAEKESIWTAGNLPGQRAQKEVSQEPGVHEPSTGLLSTPTESHALATADHDDKGSAQQPHDATEVKDLGWNEHPKQVPTPLVGGLPNENLWLLVRRFNKQMYHVKATPTVPPGGLDLNLSDEEEFSPDKLRSNVERLYMTVIVGVAGLAKHIARIRSWNETRRTAGFCAAYFVAWLFDYLSPAFFTLILVLVVYPPARSFLFPPAPLALVDASTGGMKKPTAGMLGSHDSMTGAPEKHQGEAVEQEAHNFVSGLAAIGLSSATGKHPANDTQSEGGVIDSTVPDPSKMAAHAADAKDSTSGDSTVKHDKAKQPMEAAMWQKARPVMHIIANVADVWERLANALSPTPPFPKEAGRLRLGSLVVPVIAVAVLTSSTVFVKMTTFITGSAFFGDPIMSRGIKLLNEKVPNWQDYLDIRNTLLKGFPTNAQLTLTLLRIGEANKAPLPPPPQSDQAPSSRPPSLHGDDVPMSVSHEEVQDAIHPEKDGHAEEQQGPAQPKKAKAGSRILGFFKKTTRVGVEATLGTDRLKAAAGSGHAKNRLGVLPNPNEETLSGPVDFKARYQGKKGYVYISTSATTPCVSFTRDTESVEKAVAMADIKPVFSIAIADIQELKKVGGLGWKVKLVVGWAMDREVADGLEIIDKAGNSWTLTALPLREELFNRLVAMGGQKWESW